MTTRNLILDELHVVREQLLNDAGGTLDALVDRLPTNERRLMHSEPSLLRRSPAKRRT